ncbi:MAG: hypothetical protein ACFB10_12865 [Salibacteraceae bacterium]
MKLLLSLFLSLQCLLVLGTPDPVPFPNYDAVVQKFYALYSTKDKPSGSKLAFEKRPDGWHVALIDYNSTPKVIKRELFWNAQKQKYTPVPFTMIGENEDNAGEMASFINVSSKRYYQLCPYYGYTGWDKDMIDAFGDAKTISDSNLYALGRAYSSYASNLLHNNSGMADFKVKFELPEGKNSLQPEQLAQYRQYRHKAIEKYAELEKRDPEFKTIVGNIGMKVANEHLTAFLDLRTHQNEKEAQKELADGLYSEFYRAVAKNYLNSCDRNAILFANGDNDTYPLLYMQVKYGVRPDVLVINLSLLSTSRYIDHLREKIGKAPELQLSFTQADFANDKRQFVMVNQESKQASPVGEVIEFLKKDDKFVPYGDTQYPMAPSRSFTLPMGDQTIEWSIKGTYFLRGHLMLLDILHNNPERPIYFTTTMSVNSFFGLQEYFQLEGLAYRLTATKTPVEGNAIASVDPKVLSKNLQKTFDWSGLANMKGREKLMGHVYRQAFHRLVAAYIEQGKNDMASAALDKCMELFPDAVLHYDIITLALLEDHYKLDKFDQGNAIAKTLIYNLQNDLNRSKDPTLVDRSPNNEAIMERVIELIVDYQQDNAFPKLMQE